MHRIAHIINPFIASKDSDLFTAQPITFESMLHARDCAKNVIDIQLFTTQYEEDLGAAPAGFTIARNLNRSVQDLNGFKKNIKLPLIADILERLYEASDADYLIYTNVDIGLYPDFYLKVNEMINSGLDAFIINRRRLPAKYTSVSELDDIYKERGKKHPGFDCFVFHRSIFPRFKLAGICIGVPFIEISFAQNLFAYSSKFKLFENEFLTFHIGMEIFRKRTPKEYFEYNRQQFWKLIPKIKPEIDLAKFPYADQVWLVKFIKWGLHPCIPIRVVLKLMFNKL